MVARTVSWPSGYCQPWCLNPLEQELFDMKAKTIDIVTFETKTRVRIASRGKKLVVRYFKSIDDAWAFVLPQGGRETSLLLNGFDCAPYAWWSRSQSRIAR